MVFHLFLSDLPMEQDHSSHFDLYISIAELYHCSGSQSHFLRMYSVLPYLLPVALRHKLQIAICDGDVVGFCLQNSNTCFNIGFHLMRCSQLVFPLDYLESSLLSQWFFLPQNLIYRYKHLYLLLPSRIIWNICYNLVTYHSCFNNFRWPTSAPI